jgi:hypothetical protein
MELTEIWPDWPNMPLVERIARIMALKHVPVNCCTKSYADRHWAEYAAHARIVIEESKNTDAAHVPLQERIARIFALRDVPKPRRNDGLLGIMEDAVGLDINYLAAWIEKHYTEYMDFAKMAAEEVSKG